MYVCKCEVKLSRIKTWMLLRAFSIIYIYILYNIIQDLGYFIGTLGGSKVMSGWCQRINTVKKTANVP